MAELKLSDPLKSGYYAYHIAGGKIDDVMRVGGLYRTTNVERIIQDGWSFVCRTKKYRKGQRASIPASQIIPAIPKVPKKITGIIIKNLSPNKNYITCMTLRNAYDKLLMAMTDQDRADFLNGKMCLQLKIIQTLQ